MRTTVALFAVVCTLGCGSGTPSSPTAASESLTLRLQTTHFQIFAGNTTDSTLRAAADRLEAEYSRVLSDLGVASHAMTTVRIWQDQTTYFNELIRYFGVRYSAAGYITGPTELRLIENNDLNSNVVHEFVHAVSLDVNPRFGNNPRWLWETVALYETASSSIRARSITPSAEIFQPCSSSTSTSTPARRSISSALFLVISSSLAMDGPPFFA